jgi:acetyltransferase
MHEDPDSVLIRPIRPSDESAIARFHKTLSERSVYFRYFHVIPLGTRTDHERLARICFADPQQEVVLVAENVAEQDGDILAVARLTKLGEKEAEFAVLIGDPFQGHGLGTRLVKQLLNIARAGGLERVKADMLGENRQMIEICRHLGMRLKYAGDGVVSAVLEFTPSRP